MDDKQIADSLKGVYDTIKEVHANTGAAKYVRVMGLLQNATSLLSYEVSLSMKAGVTGTNAAPVAAQKSQFGTPPTPAGYGGKAAKKKTVVVDKVANPKPEKVQIDSVVEDSEKPEPENIPTESIVAVLSKLDAGTIAARYNAEQLKAMCDAIGIEYPSRTTSVKALSKRIVAHFNKPAENAED